MCNCSDFISEMPFTQQLFHLEFLFFVWIILVLTIIIIILDQILAWSCLEKRCLLKKHMTLFFSLLKMKKKLCLMNLFLCLSRISLGRYSKKIVIKSVCVGGARHTHRGIDHLGGAAHRRLGDGVLHNTILNSWPKNRIWSITNQTEILMQEIKLSITRVLKFNLYDYSDAYIFIRGNIIMEHK